MNRTPSCKSFERPTTLVPLSSVCTCSDTIACVMQCNWHVRVQRRQLHDTPAAYIVDDADTGAAQVVQVSLCIMMQIRACNMPGATD
jgi:hypothetical protein